MKDNYIEKLEKHIVNMVNFRHDTNFKVKDLMEWATIPVTPQEGEVLYKAGRYYCAFKEKK